MCVNNVRIFVVKWFHFFVRFVNIKFQQFAINTSSVVTLDSGRVREYVQNYWYMCTCTLTNRGSNFILD